MDNGITLPMHELKLSLQRLKRLDPDLQVAGAAMHRYENHPLSETGLYRFESKLGIRLPADYREFLLRIGYGAGPNWGLWSPDRVLAELENRIDDWHSILEEDETSLDLAEEVQKEWADYRRQHSGPPLARQPFPFTCAQAEEYNRRIPGESNRPWLGGFDAVDGCITVGENGAAYRVLVVSGDVAGSMWEKAGNGFYIGWRPARRPSGVGFVWNHGRNPLPALSATPTFLEWYCAWIEQCLVDLCPDPGGYLNLGLTYQGIGRYAEAVENWDKAIQMTPSNPLAYYYRGLARQELQQIAEAVADYKRSLGENPDPWTQARAEERLHGLDAT